jgi:hypothetical protein
MIKNAHFLECAKGFFIIILFYFSMIQKNLMKY